MKLYDRCVLLDNQSRTAFKISGKRINLYPLKIQETSQRISVTALQAMAEMSQEEEGYFSAETLTPFHSMLVLF